jgi:small-conductance mechanosensitive channel
MKEMVQEISEMAVFEFLIIGILLFLALRLVQKGLTVYTLKKQINPYIRRLFPIIEFSVWMGFLIWGARHVFQTGIAGSIALLVLIVGILTWAGSFVVKDWIAGVVFKAEDRYRVDDIVCFHNTRGRLKHLGYRSLTIETDDGSTVEIPYSALVRESAIEKIPRESACAMFKLPVPSQMPFPDARQRLRAVAMSAPWSSLNRSPNIRLVEREETHYTVEVAAYLIDQRYAPHVEAYVKQHFK